MPANPHALPELPAPSDKAGSWPTFFLSLAERRAIGNGMVRYTLLNVTGQLSRSPAAMQSTNRPAPLPAAKPTHVPGPTQPLGLPLRSAPLPPTQQPIRSTARSTSVQLQRPVARGYTIPFA